MQVVETQSTDAVLVRLGGVDGAVGAQSDVGGAVGAQLDGFRSRVLRGADTASRRGA